MKGTVSGAWKNQVPLDGFKALMAVHGFKVRKKHGFYLVQAGDDDSSNKRRSRRSFGSGRMDVEVKDGKASIALENANLGEVLKTIAEQAELTVIKEQNAILITGVASRIENIKKFLDLVDVQTPQVQLECFIVEYKQGEVFGLGLSSGTTKKAGAGLPRANAVIHTDGLLQVGKEGSFMASVGVLPDRFELELSALENNNRAKVLARP